MQLRVPALVIAVLAAGLDSAAAQARHGVTHGTPPNPQTHGSSQSPSQTPPPSGQRPGAVDSAFVAGVVTGVRAQGALGPVIYYTVYGGTYIGSGYSEYGTSTYVDQAPPPNNVEVLPPAPAPAMAWIPGRWSWNGAQYYWVDGHWVSIPGGLTSWVPGHWAANGLGYYWEPGYWRR